MGRHASAVTRLKSRRNTEARAGLPPPGRFAAKSRSLFATAIGEVCGPQSPTHLSMRTYLLLSLAALAIFSTSHAQIVLPEDVVFERGIEFANPDSQHLQLDIA